VKRAALLLLFVAVPARAELFLEKGEKDYRSPQHFALELKFGLYSPDIDSTPGLTGKPFSDVFVSQDDPNLGRRPSGALMTTLEFDWQIWHGFGSLGIAASVGFSRRSSHSFEFAGDTTSCVVPSCTRSSDTTTLTLMPFTWEAVYRFDVLTRWRIPIVPYLKGGLAWYLWWIERGDGGLAYVQNGASKEFAIGAVFGLVAHPGVALLLDILDPSAARVLDSELGINHTYLFFEGNFAWINGFGNPDKIVLSDTTWNAGIAFEF
jgi:hypothetical protein